MRNYVIDQKITIQKIIFSNQKHNQTISIKQYSFWEDYKEKCEQIFKGQKFQPMFLKAYEPFVKDFKMRYTFLSVLDHNIELIKHGYRKQILENYQLRLYYMEACIRMYFKDLQFSFGSFELAIGAFTYSLLKSYNITDKIIQKIILKHGPWL